MIGALVLIATGVLFLLTNLGLLDGGAWIGMISMWPVVVIAAGVALIVPREAEVARAGVAGLALVAVLTGGTAVYAQEQPFRGRVADVEATLLPDLDRVDVNLETGAGRIRVSGGAAPSQAVTGRVGLSTGQRLVAEGGRRDNVQRVRIAAEGRWFRSGANPNRAMPWDIRVTDSTPVFLRVAAGTGEAELDLRGLVVEEARIDVGLGRIDTILPDRGRPRVRIDNALGQVVVQVPSTIPARIVVGTGMGSTTVEGDFRRESDVYITAGWEDADERLDVTIEAGLGSVRVVRN